MQLRSEGYSHQDPSLLSLPENMEQENHQRELLKPSKVDIVGQEPKSCNTQVTVNR